MTDDDAPRADLQVVARVATILRMFAPGIPTIRLTDAAAALNLGRSTVHRYLASMEHHGFLRRDEGASLSLGPLVDQLGALSSTRWRLLDAAAPILQQLADTTHQTAVLSVWGGSGPVIVRATEDETQVVHIAVRVGGTLPAESAQGLVFLAHLNDQRATERLIRQQGAARGAETLDKLAEIRGRRLTVSDGVTEGVRTIAAPVIGGDGQIEAALALVGTLNSVPRELDSGIAQALDTSARELSAFVTGTGKR